MTALSTYHSTDMNTRVTESFALYPRLPPIYITARLPLRAFVLQMADIAEKTGRYAVERHVASEGDQSFDIVNFSSNEASGHEGLIGQLITHSESKDRVTVEIRAVRWHETFSPSFNTYVTEAKRIICPLLTTYNRQTGSRYRLTIKTRKALEPSLPPRSASLSKSFAAAANRSCLHPFDWKRFYRFVSASSARSQLTENDIFSVLVREGFSDTYATHIT